MTLTLASAERQLDDLGPDPATRLVESVDDNAKRSATRVLRFAARTTPGRDDLDKLSDWADLDEAVSDYVHDDELSQQVRRIVIKSSEQIYRPDSPHNWWSDVIRKEKGDGPREILAAGRDRLERSNRLAAVEGRDLTSGSFAGNVVPQFWTEYAAGPVRPGAPTVAALDFYGSVVDLPPEGMNLAAPRSTTSGGPTAGAQASQGDAATETDAAYVDISRPVVTVSSKLETSLQLADRLSPVAQAFLWRDINDSVLTEVDRQALNADGTSGTLLGIRSVVGAGALTVTDASPTRGEVISRVARVAGDLAGVRKAWPDTVIAHSRRVAWLLGGLTQGASTDGASVSQQIDFDVPAPFTAKVAGLNLLVDDNLPVTLGAGTEDTIVVVRARDFVLALEPNTVVTADYQTLANTLQCTLTARRFAWASFDRYRGTSVGLLLGTLLTAPGAW